ncbi:Hypothetical protein PMT_2790 [Prochlorococcus marinus str. MIT 9313]|uniref:Uncharacterized protein n=1 Tax=Prochlorococcus marinus (strain MIT 9313) TaxID=74547 RepID=B9ESG3_PROMM|nr:Hypothetical protein PMT_2790 [Prochlorococcus marinus str. MIT 9313]
MGKVGDGKFSLSPCRQLNGLQGNHLPLAMINKQEVSSCELEAKIFNCFQFAWLHDFFGLDIRSSTYRFILVSR